MKHLAVMFFGLFIAVLGTYIMLLNGFSPLAFVLVLIALCLSFLNLKVYVDARK